jgi:ribosomal protein S18 acetylase RimI-like enzyme
MRTVSVTVRRAVFGDESLLRELRLEALTEAPWAFGSTYQRELARTPSDWQCWLAPGMTLILEEEGTARGLVAGTHDAEDPRIVYLLAMWVHPELRGTGAADLLVGEHLNWACSVDATLVRLDVMATNDRARRFYERLGFGVTGREQRRPDDGRVELQVEHPLESRSEINAVHDPPARHR